MGCCFRSQMSTQACARQQQLPQASPNRLRKTKRSSIKPARPAVAPYLFFHPNPLAIRVHLTQSLE